MFGAPGVGALVATGAPLACARVNAAVSVMPVPETCAPAACASVSGAATVIVAGVGAPPLPPPPPPPLPPALETTTAVSGFAPLSMVMVWPALKPAALATGITVAPAAVSAPTVVAPAVPTVAMTAVSAFAPVSIDDRLAGGKVRHAGHFDIGRAGGRSGRQRGGGLQQEIGAVAVGVGAVREAARAPIGRADRPERAGPPKPPRPPRRAPARGSRSALLRRCLDNPRRPTDRRGRP